MIPQNEFTDEITGYIDSFMKAALAAGPDAIGPKTADCAKLITNLARSVEFEPWPPRSPAEENFKRMIKAAVMRKEGES